MTARRAGHTHTHTSRLAATRRRSRRLPAGSDPRGPWWRGRGDAHIRTVQAYVNRPHTPANRLRGRLTPNGDVKRAPVPWWRGAGAVRHRIGTSTVPGPSRSSCVDSSRQRHVNRAPDPAERITCSHVGAPAAALRPPAVLPFKGGARDEAARPDLHGICPGRRGRCPARRYHERATRLRRGIRP